MSKDFQRHAAHRKKRLGNAWRRPKGLHNKMRLQKKGHRVPVKEGYRTKAADRGKRKGLTVTTIYNAAELEALDPEEHGIVVGKVGTKKKLALLDAIGKKGFTLLTGSPAEQAKAIKEAYEDRKKRVEEKRTEREKTRKELEKEAEKKEKEGAGDEDKKDLADKVEEETAGKPEEKPTKSAKKAAKKTAKKAAPEKSKEEQTKDKVLTKARD